jgi:putative flippase GtrA
MTRLRPADDARTLERAIRFVIVGAVNTGFGYVVFAALVLLGLGTQIALAISFIAGILWNFRTHGSFVFGTQGYTRLPIYAAVYLVLYLLNSILLANAITAGTNPLVAQAAIAVLVAVISFVSLSWVLRKVN